MIVNIAALHLDSASVVSVWPTSCKWAKIGEGKQKHCYLFLWSVFPQLQIFWLKQMLKILLKKKYFLLVYKTATWAFTKNITIFNVCCFVYFPCYNSDLYFSMKASTNSEAHYALYHIIVLLETVLVLKSLHCKWKSRKRKQENLSFTSGAPSKWDAQASQRVLAELGIGAASPDSQAIASQMRSSSIPDLNIP